jgi:hypothetical protein
MNEAKLDLEEQVVLSRVRLLYFLLYQEICFFYPALVSVGFLLLRWSLAEILRKVVEAQLSQFAKDLELLSCQLRLALSSFPPRNCGGRGLQRNRELLLSKPQLQADCFNGHKLFSLILS